MRAALVASLVLLVLGAHVAAADHRGRGRSRWGEPRWQAQEQAWGEANEPSLTSGAIARSRSTGNIGWSYGYADQESAKAAALAQCNASDCEWLVAETGIYAVLVTAPSAPNVYYAWDASLANAQQRALEMCSAEATGCTVTRWVSN